MARKKLIVKFNKSVDSGPLPEGLDTQTAQTIQNERIRRQVTSKIGAYPGKKKPQGY